MGAVTRMNDDAAATSGTGQLDAIVFDFDGLIADTEWPEYRAIAEQFERHGLNYPPEGWVHVIGSSWEIDWVSDLELRLGRSVDREELLARRKERGRELRVDLALLPGVEELVRAALDVDLPLAVASSSPRSWVEPHLERLGLEGCFRVIRTRDDVALAKPAPDLFLAACAGLDVDPRNAVALEDSANGTTAAKSAGMRCVAVPNRLTRFLDLSHADLVVDSLLQVDLPMLRALVRGHEKRAPSG
jgi:HAD superfamily hydrolase (TIGR01509 family)